MLQQLIRRADVRRHDHDGVPEVDRSPLTIRQPPVVEQLQKNVEDVGVGLLDLVEQDHAVGSPPHRLGELPPFVVADIPGRRADEARHRVLLHVLRHVESHDCALVVEHELRQGLCKLRLPHSRRSEEDKRADRPVRILEPRAGTAQRVRDRIDRLLLPHDSLVEARLHVHELLHLALEQPIDGDSRPGGDDGGDVVLVDLFLDHPLDGADRLAALRELVLERRQEAVPDLRHTLQVAVPLGPFCLHAKVVDLPRDLLDPVEHVFLARPARRKLVAPRLRLGKLSLDRLAHGRRLLRHRRQLDLELRHPPLRLVELDRRRVDLHPQSRRRLVHEVDRLVGQESIGDVALGEHGCRGERRIADPHAMVRLVAFLQPTQNRDRLCHGRLADEHRLKTPLERRILLDVLAILVEGRSTNGSKLAAREHRLEQVAGRNGAFRSPRADDGMELVDKEDDLPLGRSDLGKHRLQPLFELTPVLRTCNQCADIERPYALAFQPLRYISRNDALCQALGDRGLADAGLADQYGIVLRPARKHLNRPPDLLVASDHRVELPGLGSRREVAAELRQRLVRSLRILRRDPLPSTHILQRRQNRLARRELEREQEMLDRDVLVIERLCLCERIRKDCLEATSSLRLCVRARHRRQRPKAHLRRREDRLDVGAGAANQRSRQLLLEQRNRQMVGRQLGIPGALRKRLGTSDCLAGFDGQLVEVHDFSLLQTVS